MRIEYILSIESISPFSIVEPSSPDLNNNMSDKVPNKSLMRYEKKSHQMPAQSVLTFNNQTALPDPGKRKKVMSMVLDKLNYISVWIVNNTLTISIRLRLVLFDSCQRSWIV